MENANNILEKIDEGWSNRLMKLRCLQRADACSLQPLLAFDDLELNGLALFERSVALGHNRALMYENVWAAFTLDKAVALFSVKPLHCSLLFTHGFTLFFWLWGKPSVYYRRVGAGNEN